jgi:Predicted nucleotide kinase (related to CMP and AMP kinases)
MRVAVTGTPGTGKTTATELVGTALSTVHLNDAIHEHELTAGHDERRDSAVADIDAVVDWLDGRSEILVESHLAHHAPADRVVVLRCHPEELERRLRRREEPPESIAENAESEALDIVLAEAVDRHGRDQVYEIDTTDRDPTSVAADIEAVVAGEREPAAGTVSFVDYL